LIVRSLTRRIVNALLIMLLVGFFIVRFAVRRYATKELSRPPTQKPEITLGGRW